MRQLFFLLPIIFTIAIISFSIRANAATQDMSIYIKVKEDSKKEIEDKPKDDVNDPDDEFIVYSYDPYIPTLEPDTYIEELNIPILYKSNPKIIKKSSKPSNEPYSPLVGSPSTTNTTKVSNKNIRILKLAATKHRCIYYYLLILLLCLNALYLIAKLLTFIFKKSSNSADSH